MENVIRVENGKYIAGKASGESVHANMLTKLWENPNPSASFGAQTITLASDDYDFLLVMYRQTSGRLASMIFPKGINFRLFTSTVGSGATTRERDINYVSDTQLSVQSAYQCVGTSAYTTDNSLLVPDAVYGFKKSLDITAIVSNVSTDATKCILSDNVTNVDDAIDGMTWKYLDSTAGNAEIAIPANVTEVYARSYYSSFSFSFHFLTVEDDINVDRSSGFYASATNYCHTEYTWAKATRKAKLYGFNFAGTDYTSSTTTKWYYKTK